MKRIFVAGLMAWSLTGFVFGQMKDLPTYEKPVSYQPEPLPVFYQKYRSLVSENDKPMFALSPEKLFHQDIANRPSLKWMELPNRIKLQYIERGSPSGVLVILLHQYPDSRRSYEPVMLILPSLLHVNAVSQRGPGNSDRPAEYVPKEYEVCD